jgi:hypothetical protein
MLVKKTILVINIAPYRRTDLQNVIDFHASMPPWLLGVGGWVLSGKSHLKSTFNKSTL